MLLLAMLVLVLAVFWLDSPLFSDAGMPEFGMQARSQMTSQSALSLTAERATLFLLVFIIVSILGLGAWSITTRKPPRELFQLGFHPTVRNLFLAVQYYRLAEFPERKNKEVGFLRTLGSRNGALVAARAYKKGDHIVLSLSSLPGFPKGDIFIDAVVTRCTSLGGDPANYLVETRFLAASDEVKSLLSSYLIELTKRRRYAYS